jgi:hypothetical protein
MMSPMSRMILAPEQRIRQRYAGFPEGERLGNVSPACPRLGISRKTFYNWRRRFVLPTWNWPPSEIAPGPIQEPTSPSAIHHEVAASPFRESPHTTDGGRTFVNPQRGGTKTVLYPNPTLQTRDNPGGDLRSRRDRFWHKPG